MKSILQAFIYYYPQTIFGHIAVKIRFTENVVPDRMVRIEKRNEVKDISGNIAYRDTFYYREEKLQSRIAYRPMIIKENGNYFIYGQKNGVWQETELENLAVQELELLDNFVKNKSDKVEPDAPIIQILKQGHHPIKRTDYFFDWGLPMMRNFCLKSI